MERLRDRVAVITGAASGIGLALATRLAHEGMRVALADVEADPLDAAAGRLHDGGAEVIAVPTDVADAASLTKLAERTLDAFGAVHLVCNVAGVFTGAPFTEFPEATFDWVMRVNLGGTINGCRTFLPLLRRQDEGHIVNTGSTVFATGHTPLGTAYTASKFGVVGFTESLHRELRAANDTVHVSLLTPGPTDTRIPDAERNLPAGVPSLADNPSRRVIVEALKGGGSEGLMPPAEVAAQAVEGIREQRFHIVTHPGPTIEAIQGRLDWMRTGFQPPAHPVLEPRGIDG